MECENCKSAILDTDAVFVSQKEVVCVRCGCINDLTTQQYDFINEKQYNRCVEHESQTNEYIRCYMSELQKTWTASDLAQLQKDIDTAIEKHQKSSDKSKTNEKALVLGVVLIYASKNHIMCNINAHRQAMHVTSKEFGKALRTLNAGVISEGLCDPSVRAFVAAHGDTGIVRPKSMRPSAYNETDPTYTLAQTIQNKARGHSTYATSTTTTSTSTRSFLDSLMSVYFEGRKADPGTCRLTHAVYGYLSTTSLKVNEGDIMTSLVAFFVVLRHKKLEKTYSGFCLKTRMSSVPTFGKMVKAYVDHAANSDIKMNISRILNVGIE